MSWDAPRLEETEEKDPRIILPRLIVLRDDDKLLVKNAGILIGTWSKSISRLHSSEFMTIREDTLFEEGGGEPWENNLRGCVSGSPKQARLRMPTRVRVLTKIDVKAAWRSCYVKEQFMNSGIRLRQY
jgi:hypothetical protein